jgi:hypothetical protein
MTWSECRSFGVVEILSINNTVKLYYNPYSFQFAGNPLFLNIESANWQGNNLILKGYDNYGNTKVYVMDNFNSYRPIF